MKFRLKIGIALAAILPSIALTSAHAQTSPEPKKNPDVVEVDRVVVTANRREETAQKVSGVVQSVSAEQLRKDGISELRQLQTAVPGLSIANQEGNVELFIRGVGSANNTELGDPAAAPHLNNVYIPRPRGLGTMFYDLERVEVNKGPQGTLYGRNAMAGTLNIITAKPRLGQFGGFAQVEVSNRSGSGAEAALNVPVREDMALRGAFSYAKKDAGFQNVSTDPAASKLKPGGLEENYGGRLSFLWLPTDSLRLTAMADAGKESGTGYPGANIFGAVTASKLRPEALDLRNVLYRGSQGDMTNDLKGIQGKVEYDLGNITAEFSSSYRTVDFKQANAASEGVDYPTLDCSAVRWDNFSNVYWATKSKSNINELRFSSNNDKARFRWSAGAFNFEEKQQVGFLSVADRGYCCYSGTEFTMPDVSVKSTAVFADGTFSVSESLRAIGGLRYTNESKYRYGIGGNLALTLGGENFACCVATRFGTEGFVPNMLNRPNFDLSTVTNRQQIAQFLLQSIKTPGARDTMIGQIGAIANGTNTNGNCFVRSDIDNGFVKCPTLNPSDRNGGFSYANLTIPSQQVGRSKANYGDFRIGIEKDLGKDRMIYAKLSSGHKGGGFNDSFNGSNIPETFEPERLVVAEAGMRNAFDFGGRRALFNATGFYYDYKNQVFQDLTCINFDATATPPCTGCSLVNRNVGASRLGGLELESKISLSANTKLDLNATLLKTKITKGQVADVRGQDFSVGGQTPLVSLVGNKLPLASDVSISARIQQSFALGNGKFDWQALVAYRSAFYLTQFNESEVVFFGRLTENRA